LMHDLSRISEAAADREADAQSIASSLRNDVASIIDLNNEIAPIACSIGGVH